MATALMECGGGRMITGEEDGMATLKKILGDDSKRKKMGEKAKKIILDNAGAVEKHISLISDIIKAK
jgi:3-deoxy-D-manno-octulosonic-acid transferase